MFYEQSLLYLFQLIPPNINVYDTRSSQSNKIPIFKIRHNFFKDPFLPALITKWNNLDIYTQNSSLINVFKKELLKFVRPEPNFFYIIHDAKGLKLHTRLQLEDCGLNSVI